MDSNANLLVLGQWGQGNQMPVIMEIDLKTGDILQFTSIEGIDGENPVYQTFGGIIHDV